MSRKYINAKVRKSIEHWVSKIKKEKIDTLSKDKTLKQLDLPYKYRGSGKHRIVFDIGKGYVLKVAGTLNGLKSNKREVELYNESRGSLRKHLGKIAAHGRGWLVMKKMDKKLPKEEKYKEKVEKVYRKFQDNGVKINDILNKNSGKPRRANVRINNKRQVVLIDYANTKKQK